jgi:hypothetical protein
MCIFKKIPKLGLILFSSVFHSKVWIFFHLNYINQNSSPQFSFGPRIYLSQIIPFRRPYLIFTTLSDANNLSAQLVRLIVFHLGSIQTSPDFDYQPMPHAVTPLHPPVTPPCGNQELPHMRGNQELPRRWELHNFPPHPFSILLWVSLAQELTLIRAQITAATTPRCRIASVTPPPRATVSEVSESPSSSPSIHGERVLAVVGPP